MVRHAARHARGGPNFPAEYPPSALLGCVRLRDCLAHEEYAAAHPDGEENGCAGLLMLGLGLGSTLTLTLTLTQFLTLTWSRRRLAPPWAAKADHASRAARLRSRAPVAVAPRPSRRRAWLGLGFGQS